MDELKVENFPEKSLESLVSSVEEGSRERSETEIVKLNMEGGYYPKPDTGFGKKECLEIDLFDTGCYQTRPSRKIIHAYSWLCFFSMGVLTGLTAFLIDWVEEVFTDNVWDLCQDLINRDHFVPGWLVYSGFSLMFACTAALISVYIGPGAIGSGVAEIMGYLNGVNYPLCISFRTLMVKIFGVTLAVCAGLRVGKEGPLAHIGACIGVGMLYLPLGFTKYFRNDHDKRELVAGGAAAGVSAAFGSPIGGSLFGFEISSPASFWSFKLMWKIFFASSMATFVLNFLEALKAGGSVYLINSGLIKFGQQNSSPYNLVNLPIFFVFGYICGILGAAFVFANGKINELRKRYLTTSGLKVA